MSYQYGSDYNKRELEISIQTRNCSWKCIIKSQICLNLIQLYHSWILQHQYSIKIAVEYSQPNTYKTLNVGHVRNDSTQMNGQIKWAMETHEIKTNNLINAAQNIMKDFTKKN
eukprot:140927_1